MIWLASFPRSGNTFLRNVLYEVYGITSSTFHREPGYPVDVAYETYPVVKTHLLPGQLEPADSAIKAVYLVRDGRDALVSLAHHKKDIYDPGSDFYENLREAILAAEGSYFGGWSEHVKQWIERADIVIRFEDLIKKPLECAERLSALMELPEPRREAVPTFEDLKYGTPQYGAGKAFVDEPESRELSSKQFRKGKIGSWAEEMPEELHDLFWNHHGSVMERLGYSYEGGIEPLHPDLDGPLMAKLGNAPAQPERKRKVLIEATKLAEPKSDGVKRYVFELLSALVPVAENPYSQWAIDVYIDTKIYTLQDYKHLLNVEVAALQRKLLWYERLLLGVKAAFRFILPGSVYRPAANWYRNTGIRRRLAHFRTWVVQLRKQRQLRRGERLTKEDDPFFNYDLIHLTLPQNYEPFLGSNPAFVTTIHDLTHLTHPELHLDRNIELAHEGIGFVEDYHSHVIAVSRATASDLMKNTSVPGERISVVHEAANGDHFRVQANPHLAKLVRDKYRTPHAPFLLCLGTLEPRKNLERTVQAFEKMVEAHPGKEVHLVVAGKPGWKLEGMEKAVNHLPGRIHFTGFIDEVDLPVIYAEALVLCYVSLYEGFGLPMLEAMRCGTPVICGHSSAMPEVAGKGGIAVEPRDINAIADAMWKVISNEPVRNALATGALRQARQFSWRKAVVQTLEVYQAALAQSTQNH